MKKKPINKFDSFVDRLVQEFNNIPNFDLTSTDEIGNKLFNVITFRLVEVSSYKELVCNHFFPATNKAIHESKIDFQNSRYKVFLKNTQPDFEETLYDTVRLAYVGLFHKLENFINDVILLPELLLGDLYETEGTVDKWAKNKFNFEIKDWRQFYITHKINWICNCVKHKDGFPLKNPKPIGFQYADEKQRIRIKPEEFKKDCELLIDFYPLYIQTIFMFAQHKLATEKPLIKEDWKHSPVLYEKQLESFNNLESKMNEYVNLLRKMK